MTTLQGGQPDTEVEREMNIDKTGVGCKERRDSKDMKSFPIVDIDRAEGEQEIGIGTQMRTQNTKASKEETENLEEYEGINKRHVKETNEENMKEVLRSEFDRYGFKKAAMRHDVNIENYNKWFSSYASYSIKQKKKWHVLFKSNGLKLESENTIPTRFPPKSDKVKKMVRKGIPAEWRGNAWFFYGGGYEKWNKHKGVYLKIVQDTAGVKNKDTEVIERDLYRTFPDNVYYNELISSNGNYSEAFQTPRNETELVKSLRRVLVAFSQYQPQIGYCQSLNFLAGLLLIFMNEERAFWLLVILTERIIPKVHSTNLEGVHIDQGVLMLCVKEYIPLLWSVIGRTSDGKHLPEEMLLSRLPPVALVSLSWFMSLFVSTLPIETTLRVWDILWYEGSKTIFRISLTIYKLCFVDSDLGAKSDQKETSENDQIELFQFLQNHPRTLLDANNLIDNCFRKIGGYGFGSLSQDEINRGREFVAKRRARNKNKNYSYATAMSDEEREALMSSYVSLEGDTDNQQVHGLRKPLMSGVSWNKNISKKMRKKLVKKE